MGTVGRKAFTMVGGNVKDSTKVKGTATLIALIVVFGSVMLYSIGRVVNIYLSMN